MYRYDEFDHSFVRQRVAQFRDQVGRRLSGALSEEEFKPLRLMNGLYLQLHAYMLRVAIPYGVLSAPQLRRLAHIARRYDRGYGHFTTRQNIQFNWIRLDEAPEILESLAELEMHALQTSGNCIRNTTADPYAGVAADEIEDPRVWCEIIRQWSSLHPEFSFLPRKFKIAVSGAEQDRAAVKFHDIGLYLRRNAEGEVGFEVLVGGGQGRTPVVAETVRDFLPKRHLLSYLEAILRVYNLLGRRDNIYKARIKILVQSVGIAEFARLVEAEWAEMGGSSLDLPESEVARIRAYFTPPAYPAAPEVDLAAQRRAEPAFDRWVVANVARHREPGYAIVTLSLKPTGGIPGDATAEQMELVADLAERYGLGEIRTTYTQNLVLPDVRRADLLALWGELEAAGLAAPNIGLAGDIIACPGLDYCSLANARSIPVAQDLSRRLGDPERQRALGPLQIKISGCINACGHHHAGHIGILGVDKRGEEFYQVTLGGSGEEDAAVGSIIGRAFSAEELGPAVETLLDTYLELRAGPQEPFLQTYRRLGGAPFKERLYGTA